MDIRINGVVVFWRASESSRAKLIEGLEGIGLGKYVPEPKTPYAALLDAVRAVYPAPEYMHVGTEKNGGVEVVRVVKGQERNEYGHIDTVAVDDNGNLLPCLQDQRVHTEYAAARANLPAIAITLMLVRVIYMLQGVTLRPSGGFYWVRNWKVEELQKVIQVVQAASLSGETRVFVMRVAHDSDSVAAIVDAARLEVEAEVAHITADVAKTGEDALGKRALKSREEAAVALSEKIQSLGAVLGVALTDLTEKLDSVRLAAASAIMARAAADSPEAAAIGADVGTAAIFGAP